MKRTVRGKVRKSLHAHGISRHSEAEMTAMSNRAFDALSQLLGDNRYLMGSEACGADATAFAFIAGAMAPVFNSPAHDKARVAAEPRRVSRPHDGRVLSRRWGQTPFPSKRGRTRKEDS